MMQGSHQMAVKSTLGKSLSDENMMKSMDTQSGSPYIPDHYLPTRDSHYYMPTNMSISTMVSTH